MAAPCVISAGTVVEDFSDRSEFTADGTQIVSMYDHWRCLDDMSKRGIATRHSYSASPTTGYITKTGMSLSLAGLNALRFDFRHYAPAEAYSTPCAIGLEFSSTGNFGTKCMRATYGPTTSLPAGYGPFRWLIGSSEWTSVGSESWSNTMVAMRVSLTPLWPAYGIMYSPYFFLDKLVLNPVTTPLVVLSFDSASTATTDITQDALADYGFSGKGFANMVDSDNVGDTGYNTWPQLKALDSAGLRMIPQHTNWLLQSPRNTDGILNRPVPPYPVEDTDYVGADDSTNNVFVSYEHFALIDQYLRSIHAYYGIPWTRDLFNPHSGLANGLDVTRFYRDFGFRSVAVRADWQSSTIKQTPYHTLPIVEGNMMQWAVATGVATHTDVMSAIAEVVSYGRYLHLGYGPVPAYWTEANLRAELAELRRLEDLGSLTVVTLSEFLTRNGVPPTSDGSVDVSLTFGASNLDINDHVKYFLMPDVDFGERAKIYDEFRSYGDSLTVAQCNVTEASIIPMAIPLLVKAATPTALRTAIDAINAVIDGGPCTLVYNDGSGALTYHVLHSPRVNYVRSQDSILGCSTTITLNLVRTPIVDEA